MACLKSTNLSTVVDKLVNISLEFTNVINTHQCLCFSEGPNKKASKSTYVLKKLGLHQELDGQRHKLGQESKEQTYSQKVIIKTFFCQRIFFLAFLFKIEGIRSICSKSNIFAEKLFAAQSLMIRNGQIFVTSFPLGMLLMPEFTNSHNFLVGFG